MDTKPDSLPPAPVADTGESNTEPVMPRTPTVGGMKIIQPLASSSTTPATPPASGPASQPVTAAPTPPQPPATLPTATTQPVAPPVAPVPAPPAQPVPAVAQTPGQAPTWYPSVSQAPVGFSAADARAQEEKQARGKRLMIGLSSVAGLVFIVVIGVLVYALMFRFSMKPVTYDNGRGSQFQLTFYSHYSVKSVPDTTNGFQELASQVSKSGLYPLVVSITKGTTEKPSDSLINCNAKNATTVLQIVNKPSNSTVNMCSLDAQQSKNVIYLGILHSGGNYYAILVNQDVDFQTLDKNPRAAQAALPKINLTPYNKDITTIVASIKPIGS